MGRKAEVGHLEAIAVIFLVECVVEGQLNHNDLKDYLFQTYSNALLTAIVMTRQLRERMAKFLNEDISLPRESGPKMQADVKIAWIVLYQLSPS